MPQELTPREFLDRREAGEEMTLLDVREDWEVKLAPVPTPTVHIPMGEISDRLAEIGPQKGNRRHLPLRRPQRPSGASFWSARALAKFLISPAEFWPGPGL